LINATGGWLINLYENKGGMAMVGVGRPDYSSFG
jgi:hypothetical protein